MNILTVTSSSQMFLAQMLLIGVLCTLLLAWLVTFAWLALRHSPQPISLREEVRSSQPAPASATSVVRHAFNSVQTHTPAITPATAKEAVLESSLR